jgi:hypothetical protein
MCVFRLTRSAYFAAPPSYAEWTSRGLVGLCRAKVVA